MLLDFLNILNDAVCDLGAQRFTKLGDKFKYNAIELVIKSCHHQIRNFILFKVLIIYNLHQLVNFLGIPFGCRCNQSLLNLNGKMISKIFSLCMLPNDGAVGFHNAAVQQIFCDKVRVVHIRE